MTHSKPRGHVSSLNKSQPANSLHSRVFTALTVVVLMGSLGTLATLVWIRILPEQYFYDGEYIRSLLATDLNPTQAFDTFVNTAWVFAMLGFRADTPREITSLSLFMLAFIPTAAWFLAGLGRLQYWGLALLGIWVAVGSIYQGQLSKEVIALWFISLILYVVGFRRPVAWLAFVIPLIYAVAFRPYWIVIAAFWALFWWLSSRRWAFSLKLLVFAGALVAASSVYYLYRGEHITEIRERLNEFRIGSDVAQSMIVNYLPNNTILHDVANWIISWMFILFPLPVLRLFEPLQWIFFVLVISSVITFYWISLNVQRESDRFSPSQLRRVRACLTFMMAFTLVQAIFEPDYGSVLKHMTDLLPMIAYLLALGFATKPKRVKHLR